MIEKIISGGQTGADRAALDFAIASRIPHGGWCPRGRLAEDGTIDARYQLAETSDSDYARRTEWNVRDADATVIFTIAAVLSGGSKSTADFAVQYRKACLHVSQQVDAAASAEKLRRFLKKHHVRILNIAGPRASEEPLVGDFVRQNLTQVVSVA